MANFNNNGGDDILAWWLAKLQCDSGGLNGRPEKQSDVFINSITNYAQTYEYDTGCCSNKICCQIHERGYICFLLMSTCCSVPLGTRCVGYIPNTVFDCKTCKCRLACSHCTSRCRIVDHIVTSFCIRCTPSFCTRHNA